MKKTLLPFFLLVSIFCNAQKLSQSSREGYLTYIYQISHPQTRNIYTKGWQVVDSTYFTKVVDSFLTAKPKAKNLPLGNYLFVTTKDDYMHYTLEESSNVWVNVVNNDRDLQILVQDTTGKVLSDAEVLVEGKKIAFDKKLSLYRHSKSYKQGLVSVSYQGHTTLINLDARFKKQFWKKVYYKSRVGWVWYYLKKPFVDIYRVVRNQHYKAHWIRRIVAIFDVNERDNLKRERHYKTPDKSWIGYHVFSKPKYRPHDTLKFKMFLLDYKKKPADEPVTVYLTGYIKDKHQTLRIKEIKPYLAGGYEFVFYLSDTLKLKSGSTYTLSFQSVSFEKWANSISYTRHSYRYDEEKQAGKRDARFTYEDYELASITYDMRLAKEKHNEDELNHIYLSAKDENEFPIPDAKVEVLVYPESVLNIKDNQVLIKDTLWKYHQNLDPVGETKITIPDSIFRNTDVSYKVETVFLNSNNERTVKTAYSKRFFEEAPIDFLVIKDSVVARYFNAQKYSQPATLITKDIFGQVKSQKTISLPYGFKTLEKEIYEVKNYQKRSYTYDALSNKAGISCYAEQTKDSLFVVIQNPRNSLVWYYVFEGDKPHFADFTTESILFKQKGKSSKNYYISLSYWWNGSIHKEDYITSLIKPTNAINIDLKTPKSIIPGAKVAIEASVTDALNKPILDADVTIYGITGKFKEVSHSAFDLVQAKRQKTKSKGRSQHNSFSLNELSISQQNHQKISWNHWRKRLDTISYYQFLYPKNGFYSTSEPSTKGITQFAPYVTKNGALDSIYYVLLDEIPVYASFTIQQPYSFRADTNKHTIKIRTKNRFITVRNIRFAPKKKTIFSVENCIGKFWNKQNKDSIHIQIEENYDILAEHEKEYLQRFALHVNPIYRGYPYHYLQQNEHVVSFNGVYSYDIWAGFFNPSQKVRFAEYNKRGIEFFFKNGYQHTFEDNVVMAEKDTYINRTYTASKPLTHFGAEVYTFKDLEDDLNPKYSRYYHYSDIYQSSKGQATLKYPFVYNPALQDSLDCIVVLTYKGKMVDDIRIHSPSTSTFYQLEPKETYHFIYLYGNRHHQKFTFKVPAGDGTWYKKEETTLLQRDDSTTAQIRRTIQNRYSYERLYPHRNIDSIRVELNQKTASQVQPLGKNTVVGYILDNNGQPVIGATVFVKGNTKLGAVTDAEGAYAIHQVPDEAILVVKAVDFKDKQVALNGQQIVNVTLDIDGEIQGISVISTAYGEVSSRSFTGSAGKISSKEIENIPIQSFDKVMQGRANGVLVQSSSGQPGSRTTVLIRGVGSINTGTDPLYIVDGIAVSAGEFSKLNPNEVSSMETLKDEVAIAMYGSRGANGVITVQTKGKGGIKPSQKLPEQAIEEATAKNLEGSGLRSNFRDDAVWQPRLRTDKNGKVSFITTFPDDITRWDVYALVGKEGGLFGSAKTQIKASKQLTAMLSMPRFAVVGDSMEVVGKATNYTSDTLAIQTRFEINKKVVVSKNQKIVNGLVEKQWLVANSLDSLSVLYALEKGEYTDGELRKLPVYPKGTQETKGYFANFYKDSSATWKFDKDKGKVTVHISADMLKIVEMELRHLKDYGYLCNEQAASKLLAYLMHQRLSKIKGTPFEFAEDIKALINRLQKNVNPNGLWGWWGVSDTKNWVSQHVLKALLEAKTQGYDVKLNTDIFVKLYVVALESDTTLSRKLENLEFLHQIKAEINYAKYLNNLEETNLKNSKNKKNFNRLGFQEYLSVQVLKQAHKLPYNLDTLAKTRKTTLYGNHYWTDADSYYSSKHYAGNEITYNTTQTTLKALKLLQNAGKNNLEEQVLAVNYILEQRHNNGYWLHTYESISALEAIYPYVSNAQGKVETPVVELSGGVNQTVSQYPFEATFSPEKDLKIQRKQKVFSPVYVTAYQQFWNENPEKISNGFLVKSHFEHNGKEQSHLEAGTPVKLVVEVDAKQANDYVLVEIPIPAGCSYDGNAYTNYNWDKQKHKICIFLDRIQAGRQTYTINLVPRYTGIYTLNPAKVEMMYKPVFVGRESLKKVVIKEKNL